MATLPAAAGAAMRRHPGHLAVFERTEGGAYVAACICRWYDPDWYAEIDAMLASIALHMIDPHFPEHGIHPEERR